MKNVAVFLILMLFFAAAVVIAAPLAGEISWWTVDGGVETSIGDGFSLSGIIGQPDAGLSMSDDTYAISGGYWHGDLKEELQHDWNVYLPIMQKR